MREEPDEASGADLARVALRQAKAAARRAGTQAPKPKRAVRRRRGERRDPARLTGVVEQLLVEHGWQAEADGGGILHRWSAIVGAERAAHWRAVAYDEPARALTVVCDSDSWAVMLRLATPQLIDELNQATRPGTVARISSRKGGRAPTTRPSPPEPGAQAALTPTRPRPTGAMPSAEYTEIRRRLRQEKAEHDASRPDRPAALTARLQEAPGIHIEARYLDEAERERAAAAADPHAHALARARAERAQRIARPNADRTSGMPQPAGAAGTQHPPAVP
ncbi:DUF721 domain-containing protein [Streptomyces lasiicapitis]|uniref:DUF721 domain-containing protein n=1 Tax=Streptomyces lasiicapitis TaxID=1923961 RepID=UPI003322B67D